MSVGRSSVFIKTSLALCVKRSFARELNRGNSYPLLETCAIFTAPPCRPFNVSHLIPDELTAVLFHNADYRGIPFRGVRFMALLFRATSDISR